MSAAELYELVLDCGCRYLAAARLRSIVCVTHGTRIDVVRIASGEFSPDGRWLPGEQVPFPAEEPVR